MHVTIDGRELEVEPGTSLLDAASRAGIEIPTLCHHPDLTPVGSCRLCLVSVAGRETPVAACTEPVSEGLVIETETEELAAQRREILELLLAECHFSGASETALAGTELGKWVQRYGAVRPEWSRSEPRFVSDSDPNPFLRVDFNECILCTRCVRACAEVQGRFVWGVSERGRETRIIAGVDTTMLEARCESCGACAAYCPTGALSDRWESPSNFQAEKVRTTCTYCGVGCQLDLNVVDDRVVGVTSVEPDVGPNGMSLCVKGRYGFDFIHHPERLTRPRVRRELLDGTPRPPGAPRGEWVEVDWDVALEFVTKRFTAIQQSTGPASLGFFASAKCSNEENYLVQKLARQVFRTHNVDHCARLCHSSTVAGLAMAFGSGAMSNSMDDVAESTAALFVIGSNTTEQHPVFGAMLRQAVLRRKSPLIVADPRRIDLAEFATLHLQQKPGTDVLLLNGLMSLILERGGEDAGFIRERCEGFEEFRETVRSYTPERVANETGVPVADLRAAADILCEHRPMAAIWAMGITQHTTGVINVLSLANLQLLLGNMGVPGGGVNPLRGQNNVQGACDMGALPNLFPGYQSVADAALRAKFESAWALSPTDGSVDRPLLETPGLTVTEMVDAAGRGDLRGLFILGENPLMTDPDVNHVRSCFERAELVVLQEIFPSETSQYADVILPGTTFAERDGTFTNTDRRVQRFRRAVSPPGAARTDWEILAELGRRVLQRQGRTPIGPHAGWEYASPDAILSEIGALTPQYAGITAARLDSGERLQWPVPSADHPGTPILHVDRFTRGKGRFHAVDHLPPHESPDAEFPLLLTTGRVLYHWHGGEMTRRSQGLNAIYPEPFVEISPEDAARWEIESLQTIRIQSRRGEFLGRAAITERVGAGVLFANFHFPDDRNVNNATIAALDPVAKIPEYKVCAVRIVV